VNTLYDSDFYAWTQEQAKLLRQQRVGISRHCELNRGNRNFGQTRTKELKNRLGILLGHLLKWQYQPELRGNSWLATIREQRREVLLQENPSLKPYLGEVIQKLTQVG